MKAAMFLCLCAIIGSIAEAKKRLSELREEAESKQEETQKLQVLVLAAIVG